MPRRCDGILIVEDLEHVPALDGQEHALGKIASDLVLDPIGLVLQAIDLLASRRNRGLVAGHHLLEQRQDLPRAFDCGPHVLLHRANRRLAK